MIYFNFFGTLIFITLLCIYVFKHCIYKMFDIDRIVLIIKQIVSIILLYVILYYADIFIQGLTPPEVVNMSTAIAYISISLFWWYMATHITNRIINCIFQKFIFPHINKNKKSEEIFVSEPDCKIIIHFNNSDDTYTNLSVKLSLIPSEIMLKKIGTNSYIEKDKKIWSQSVYACENLSDEVRLKQIVYKASCLEMERQLKELKSTNLEDK